MITTRRSSDTHSNGLFFGIDRQMLYVLTIGSVMAGLAGCGQKGNLYLTDTSSEVVAIAEEVSDDPNDY
ncbi:lipoprotein [Psychrobacter sp. F1192]|uniref:Lipoprotein n=1 Tax=Psychrobacter coccoides TaxID=2818440 RepID=A0ABS3NQR0_9GAMM|nr:lipoprotein [Psychrobacter coccoides]MBO1531403.1 lipoprotein [Psychrobacter coccoides]